MTQIPVMPNTNRPARGLAAGQSPDDHLGHASQTPTPTALLLIDTTQATPGETATITVTATDSVDHTTDELRSFTVTVGAYAGPPRPNPTAINFKPFANPTTATVAKNPPSKSS